MDREKRSYHHKDLRKALIEKGIEIVNAEGMEAFSLRKAAAACKVSHAAPYSHFESKEQLLEEMQRHITDRFYKLLEKTIEENQGREDLLKKTGVAYLSFFLENPAYFQFLYVRSNIRIDLSLSVPDHENYGPYILFKEMVFSLLEEAEYPQEKRRDILIALWSFIHGLTSLAAMKNVCFDENWKRKAEDFMDVFELSFLQKQEKKR